jgi:flagellar M-ring protein FliF
MYDTLTGGADDGASVSERLSLEAQTRSAMERQVNNLLVPAVGADNLKVSAFVELDMDSTTISSVEFAPPVEGDDEGLQRSAYRLWESSSAGEAAGGIPGTDTNGMGTDEYPYLDLGEEEYYRQYVEEVNNELNETRTNIERARGTVKRLTVSVMLNSDEVADENMADIRSLVSTALGIEDDESILTVAYLPFTPVPEPTETGMSDRTMELISLAIRAGVVLLLGLFVIMFLRSLFGARKKEQLALEGGPGMTIDYVADDDLTELDDHVPLAEIDVKGKSEDIQAIENFIDKDPAAVAQLLRNWLSDD